MDRHLGWDSPIYNNNNNNSWDSSTGVRKATWTPLSYSVWSVLVGQGGHLTPVQLSLVRCMQQPFPPAMRGSVSWLIPVVSYSFG